MWLPFRSSKAIRRCGRARAALRGPLVGLCGPWIGLSGPKRSFRPSGRVSLCPWTAGFVCLCETWTGMRGPFVCLRGLLWRPLLGLYAPVLRGEGLLMAWPGCTERAFLYSKNALCRPTMTLYRSVKAPYLLERGHTVGLRGISVVLGGPFDGVREPCIGMRGPVACLRVLCLAWEGSVLTWESPVLVSEVPLLD